MKAPTIALRKLDSSIHDRDGLVFFVFAEELQRLDPTIKKALGKEVIERLSVFATKRGFQGGLGEVLYYPTTDGHLTLMIGLGERKSFEIDRLRQASAISLRLFEKMRLKKVVAVWPTIKRSAQGPVSDADLITAAAEGYLLGAYEFDRYKTSMKNKFSADLVEFALVKKNAAGEKALQEAIIVSQAVNEARDLQNDNSDDVNPEAFAQFATKVAKEHKLKITIIDGPELKKLGLNLLHSVGRASKWQPKLIMIEYRGNPKNKNQLQALAGKGITFDTGGVNLKPTFGGSLEHMHLDMSGAADVLEVIKVASILKLKTNILAVMPIAENAIGGDAYKPGSVIRAYNGTTVEIANTDGEGRLVLADAIAYVTRKYKLDAVIDIATLTGAIIITFGERFAGLLSNHDGLANELLKAGVRTAEPLWRLPLTDGYRREIRGKKSDLVNSVATRPPRADAIQAAAFLEAFTNGVPLGHIDIAGTSMRSRPMSYVPAGGTGFGVRLLIEYLRNNLQGPKGKKR
jgi:leucyl aminopeptidase